MPKSTTVNTRQLQEDLLILTDRQELLETTTFPLNQESSLPLEPEGKFSENFEIKWWIIVHHSSSMNFSFIFDNEHILLVSTSLTQRTKRS
jgi:hypothetical protein